MNDKVDLTKVSNEELQKEIRCPVLAISFIPYSSVSLRDEKCKTERIENDKDFIDWIHKHFKNSE